MFFKKKLALLVITAVLSTTSLATHADTGASAASTDKAALTNGVVRKVDKDAKKLTLKHEEISSIEMPGMTMVFQVKDAALLDKVKVGDKVRFAAEKQGGAIVITVLEVSP